MVTNYEGLIDVTDLIIPEEIHTYFNEHESLQLYNTCFYLMEEFIKDHITFISEPDFEELFDENIHELMHSHFDIDLCYTEEAIEETEEIIEHAKKDFFKYIIPPRSYSKTFILEDPDYEYIDEQLNVLRNKPQPIQRTKEWYEFRYNLITASNAYKAFESQSVKNQLIYEKCKKQEGVEDDNNAEGDDNDNEKEVVMVNVNSTLHWGQKYEPLSVKIYEYLYQTKIEDFGCIRHEKYSFLGASPDGINVDRNSKRYGRMLEIKNIVNREINGIPKKEYWIQMQLQMEVCDLDECDFLETKFIEYPDYLSYELDTSDEIYEDENEIEFKNICLSKEDQIKGEIIYFHTKEGRPFYVYKPLDIIHPSDISEWQEKMIEQYENINYVYIKNIYWKLDVLSCVLVCRNREWFKSSIDMLEDIWNTIEIERESGFEHRAPNRKTKKDTNGSDQTKQSVCLLQFKKINVIKTDTNVVEDTNVDKDKDKDLI
jgi:putative phage-type endonuclease